MDDLVGTQDVCGGHASPGRAYVKGFRELNKLCSGAVGSTQEDWHLQAEARGSTKISWIHALTILKKTSLHISSLSTGELVRKHASGVPHSQPEGEQQVILFQQTMDANRVPISCSSIPVHQLASWFP